MCVHAEGTTLPLEPRPRSLARGVSYPKIRVSVSAGPDAGLSRELASSTLRVGSASDNHLALTDDAVSRHHCAIEPVASGVRIRDEGSRNGVFIGGLQVFDALVSGPVQLRLGRSVLGIEPLAQTVVREQLVSERFHGLLGRSARMRELFADLARLAPTDSPVLIEGEAGSGKALVAESLHAESARARGPFVVFDCRAVAATLAEGELFGRERGAEAGALASGPGVFERADGGTLVLDELAALPKDLQLELLRVLQQREVRRLGSPRCLSIDVRLLTTTSRNLAVEVRRGNFLEELYFHVAADAVQLPPLRDRMEDLPLLVEHFLERARPPQRLEDVPAGVWALLEAHRWPGNVRELSNAVQRFMATPARALPGERAPSAPSAAARSDAPLSPLRVARREATAAFERAYLADVLQRSRGNVTRAAALAAVSRQMMQKLMRKHDAAGSAGELRAEPAA